MSIGIIPSTVKREEYGYIQGTVTEVSDFPVTESYMNTVLKNSMLTRTFSQIQNPIEVRASIIPDPTTASGYKWSSSKGPDKKNVFLNYLHDELIADFFGMRAAFGFYRADYFEYFMGIQGGEGSRLVNYIPDCSEEMLNELKTAASRVAAYLERLANDADFSALSHARQIRFLCERNLLLE